MLTTRMFKVQLYLLIVIYAQDSSCTIHAIYNAGKELWKLYTMIDRLELHTTEGIREVTDLFSDGRDHEIKSQRIKLDKLLNQLEKSMVPINRKGIHNLIELPPSEIMLYKCMDTFNLFLQSINEYYQEFREYKPINGYHANTGEPDYLMKMMINSEDKILMIRKIMTNAKELLPTAANLPFAITGYASTLQSEICDSPRIISNLLIDLFTMTMIAEIKINIMAAFANIKRFSENEVWKLMNSIAKEQFLTLFGSYVEIVELNLKLADAIYLRACDPSNGNWIRNEGFYELEGTFQVTMFSYHWATCKYYSCNTAWFRKDSCKPVFYNSQSDCTDTIAECAYLGAVQVCALKDGPYKFQYVNSTELGFLGRDPECTKDNSYIIEDGTGWNANYAACACNCYRNRNKISLEIMESNVKRNKVIIGLRFVRKGTILYLQPKEGKLSTNGYLVQYAENWVHLPNYVSKSETHSINQENRVFFLDDLRLPPSYVLTGVKLNKETRGNVTGFALEIFGSPFNYETGKLNSGANSRISVKSSTTKSGKKLSFKAISSISTNLTHTPNPRNIKYVSFERSELRDDVGQSTLPFFDAVEIRIDVPSPLGGIGMFHKGVEGYAGLISLRVYGLSYTKYLTDFQSVHMTNGKVLFNETQHD